MSHISNMDDHEITVLREYLEKDFREFSMFCFKILTGQKMMHVDYYDILFHAIQRLIDQQCARMIINIPPRAGKTLIISQLLPLFAWVRAPSAQTILTGFNSDVLAESSGYIRTIMSDPDFQLVFPDVVIDYNKKSVERLGTMSAGVLHAIPPTGKMTGKGCGALVEGFAGLMAIDDYLKPDDANSPAERDKSNARFSNTLLSRLATETTPLVIIMQRLNGDDLCGYLMKGGSADTYEWLSIPGIVTKSTGSKEWYAKQMEVYGYTHVTPILYELPESEFRTYEERMFEDKLQPVSSFWHIRKTVDTLLGLLEKDPYTFYSQYMGMPVGKGKAAMKSEYLRSYENIDEFKIRYTFLTADTAATRETYSDPSVGCFWGVTMCGKLVLMDCIMDKWEVPDLIIAMREFWRKHYVFNPNRPSWKPQAFYIEDKSSGLFLNQQFLKDGTVIVRPVPRDGTANNDKFSRFLNTIPYFKSGKIYLPSKSIHYHYIIRELLGQSEYGSATGNDDFADNVADACAIAYAQQQMNYESWS
jgi:predicted phage terminase large subunit-like protein